jgi:flagellar basal-body rod protein FlgF
MENGTTIALSRLVAQQRALDVTAGNIGNANTAGYRAARMLFSDWVLREPALGRPPGDRVLSYVQDKATWRDQRPGPIATTGNPLDLAIGDPAGYFTVRSANGIRLTRGGHFGLSPNGAIVDDAGDALLSDAGQPLTLTPTDTHITVAGDGTMSSENGLIGKVAVVTASDPRQVAPEGDQRQVANTPTAPLATPHIVQGAIEGSNVEAVEETTRMMTDLREFQFVAQYVQGESDRLNNAIEKLSQRPA